MSTRSTCRRKKNNNNEKTGAVGVQGATHAHAHPSESAARDRHQLHPPPPLSACRTRQLPPACLAPGAPPRRPAPPHRGWLAGQANQHTFSFWHSVSCGTKKLNCSLSGSPAGAAPSASAALGCRAGRGAGSRGGRGQWHASGSGAADDNNTTSHAQWECLSWLCCNGSHNGQRRPRGAGAHERKQGRRHDRPNKAGSRAAKGLTR